MSAVVFDAGALTALERDDRELWTLLKAFGRRGVDVVAPSTVVAQVWRAGRRQANLARALDLCIIAPFDPLAKRVGELCGRTKTHDICDAHVALVSSIHADAVYTGDPDDIARLIAACRGRDPVVVAC